MADQRQPDLDASGEHTLQFGVNYAPHRRERLRSGRGQRAHGRSITIWPSSPTARPTQRARHFPSRSKNESRRAISTSTRWIRTSPRRKAHHHVRHAGDLEHRSRQPAAALCAACRIVSRYVAQQRPAARSGDLKRACAACFPATPLFVWQPRVSVAYQLRPALASMPASASSTTSFPRRLPILPRPMLPMRPPLSAASAARWAAWRLRPACPAARWTRPPTPTAVSIGSSTRAGRHARESARRADLPAGRQSEYLPHRHAQDAVLLPVQPRHRAGSWARTAQRASDYVGTRGTARAVSRWS